MDAHLNNDDGADALAPSEMSDTAAADNGDDVTGNAINVVNVSQDGNGGGGDTDSDGWALYLPALPIVGEARRNQKPHPGVLFPKKLSVA